MDKFDLADLRKLIELTEEIKQKNPGINIEITVSEDPEAGDQTLVNLAESARCLEEQIAELEDELDKLENEFDELEENMPDPSSTEHIDWLIRSSEVEDQIDELAERIDELTDALEIIQDLLEEDD